MTSPARFKAPILIGCIAALLGAGLTGCKAPIETKSAVKTAPAISPKLPPLRKALSCLPKEAALIAAHRGTDERWREKAENSIGALKALIDHGTLIAEIDVAGLRDGTLITFHDGVWDDISTGKGPISSSTKSDLETILLRSRSGGLTADRPPTFDEMLRTAKGKIYVEVDFKSSADYADVISAIRDQNMSDQVLLIAYSSGQAAKLKRLAPKMLRSNPPDAFEKTHAVWLGYGVGDGQKAQQLKQSGNYIIGRLGDPNRQPPLRVLRKAADILVTDQPERYDGVIGLKGTAREEYQACLSK